MVIHGPIPELNEIMSISTGVVGNEQINYYKAQEVGQQSIKNIIGDHFNDIKLLCTWRYITFMSI